MENMVLRSNDYNFSEVHAAMRRYVDADILAGVSSAVLAGRDLVDLNCVGWADKEQQSPLCVDHIFRVLSNTKLITSCAVLLLWEEGRLQLDNPIERYIPQLGKRRVLRPGASSPDDTEPAASSITIRHLLSHSAGLSYGVFDPGTPIFNLYNQHKVLNPATTLAEMMDVLADLPLAFHPGTSWEYSIATDVLARFVEVVSGQRFDEFIRSRIFDPLGMVDTGFVVSKENLPRFAAYYAGADLMNPMKPGLTRIDDAPYPQAFLRPVPRLSGAHGLVSTLPDMLALLRSLLPGGPTLLKPETIALMMTNQLPDGAHVQFAGLLDVPGKGFGLGGAITVKPSSIDPPRSEGEFEWGGAAGTHWWISPAHNLAGLLMTQRQMAFWHPFSFEFKRLVYQAVTASN